jgi:hypothetical protein
MIVEPAEKTDVPWREKTTVRDFDANAKMSSSMRKHLYWWSE